MKLRVSSGVIALGLSLAPCLQAQTTQPPKAAEETIAPTNAVALDLVVCDKKGNPVIDLRADEVEIFEDGAKQSLSDFHRVALDAAAPAGAPAPDAASRSPQTIVFLFPRLTAQMRDVVQRAADEFVKKQFVPGMTAAVLLVGDEIEPIQDYTSDPAVLKDAVKRALNATDALPDLSVQPLLSLIQSLKDQTGRKTVLLFSSGVNVPQGLEYLVDALPAVANRYRVSFYGIDPRGKDMQSRSDMAQLNIFDVNQRGVQSGSDIMQTSVDQEISGWMQNRIEGYRGGSLLARSDPRWQDPRAAGVNVAEEALKAIARATGGRMIERTNSFSQPMRQIVEDARGYYEFGYSPTIAKAEGAIRKIDVKVMRKDVEVLARPFFHVGEALETPVAEFEKPLRSALTAATLPQDVEAWEQTFHFASDGKKLEHILWVRVPLAKVAFVENAQAKQFQGRVSVLARVIDASQKVVAAFSQDFPLTPPSDQMERARGLSIDFNRRVRLAPGEYVLETAVRDAYADKLTARRASFKIAAPHGLVLSSLALGQLTPVSPGSSADDPFRLENQRLRPLLNQPIKAGQAAMTLFCVVIPSAASKDPVSATFALFEGQKVLMNVPAQLPAPDANGRIPYGSAMRVDLLPAGSYRLQVSVTQGASRAEESLAFKIVP